MTEKLETKKLSFGYTSEKILKQLSLSFEKGKFYTILGPNGSGKSTFIKNLAKLLNPDNPSVFIDNDSVEKMTQKSFAQKVAVVPQNLWFDAEFTVNDVVLMGRSPYLKRWESFHTSDQEIVEKYLKLTNTWHLKDKFITQISGGEVQRVVAARALAQETDIILLDEPTSHLDIQYQIEFLSLFQELKSQKLIIAVLHDLNLTAMFSDYIVLLEQGQLVAQGSPSEVLTKENIQRVYHLPVRIVQDEVNHCPLIIPTLLKKAESRG